LSVPAAVVEPAPKSARSNRPGHPGVARAVLIAAAPAGLVLVVAVAVGAALRATAIAAAVGVVFALAIWLGIWFGSKGFILSRLGGGSASEGDLPRAANLVDGLCATMGLPLPELVLLDDPFRGALALGRSDLTATLVLTTGLLRALDPVELEGVLAHELSHIKSGDIAAATIAAAVVLPVAPILSSSPEIVRRLVGPGRELAADERASAVTRYPPGLRDGLVKMAAGPPPVAPSALAGAATGRVLRWLWTVVPEIQSPPSLIGVLDAPGTRVAALDEA
jgi:Peptidase family M48